MVIVLMGPAGAGKSTVGAALAERLGWTFVDADDHHSPESLARLKAAVPLTDADRAGWLDALHGLIARAGDRRESLVLACSALASRHRRRLVGELRPVRFVYLKTSEDVLRERLRSRRGHVAGESILESQLATLEEPGDEALTLDGADDVETTMRNIRLAFGV
jgi:gluconokinase